MLRKGDNEPDLGDVSKFGNGVDYFLSSQWDHFNGITPFTNRIQEFQDVFELADIKVYPILCYSASTITSDRLAVFQQLEAKYEDDLCVQTLQSNKIHEWVTDYAIPSKVDPMYLYVHNPGITATGYKTIYGLVDLARSKTFFANLATELSRQT